ncbi:MAG: T9SS type A sorting domain-containing protein [Bacteroidales bacterium]|nr:T9SS type A sorting domain-containing protein [Bacteroidales bacterium]
MKKLITILFTLLLFHFMSFGQLGIDWQQSYGSMGSDYGYDIAESDGGYLVMGVAEASGGQVMCFEQSSNGGGWLLKIDYSGNLLWQKCFDYVFADRIVKAINEPYYYLIGMARLDPYPEASNLWVAKIDSLGNVIWERILGNNDGVSSYALFGQATTDGGIVATVNIYSSGGDITNWYGGYDGWIVKLDSLGDKEWDFSVGTSQSEFINSIIQTSDGGYLAGLYGKPNGIGGNVDCEVFNATGGPDAIIYKIDADGNPEWHHCYGGSGHEGAGSLVETTNGYVVAAFGGSNDGDLEGSNWHGDMDVWLFNIDFSGNIIWQKCFGGSNHEYPIRIFRSSDGGFVVFADTQSTDGDVVGNSSINPDYPSIWIFKVNGSGELLWQQSIGSNAREQVHGVVKHSDYKYTVAGEMLYSPLGDVNCSNFVPGSQQNYWVFGVSDTTVNMAETSALAVDVKVYPNPAKSVLNIDFPANYDMLNSTIEVINVNGKTSMQSTPVSHATQLDIKSLVPGLYIVKIQNNDALITRRVIIQ